MFDSLNNLVKAVTFMLIAGVCIFFLICLLYCVKFYKLIVPKRIRQDIHHKIPSISDIIGQEPDANNQSESE